MSWSSVTASKSRRRSADLEPKVGKSTVIFSREWWAEPRAKMNSPTSSGDSSSSGLGCGFWVMVISFSVSGWSKISVRASSLMSQSRRWRYWRAVSSGFSRESKPRSSSRACLMVRVSRVG